jgi:hypothetical protein
MKTLVVMILTTLLFTSEVTGFFNWSNASSHITALGSTQPLTEMSVANLPGGKCGQCVKLTSPPSVSWLSRKVLEPWCLTTLWACMACYRDSFTFYCLQVCRWKEWAMLYFYSFIYSFLPCSMCLLVCGHVIAFSLLVFITYIRWCHLMGSCLFVKMMFVQGIKHWLLKVQ